MDQPNFPEMEEFNCFDQVMDEYTYQSNDTAFNSFKCNTMTDYAKLFPLSRCLIHSDICNSLVLFGMKKFGYYPFQDWTRAAFGYTAITGGLKESFHNIRSWDVYEMAIGGCTAGPVGCVLRHADANNEIIGDFDDKTVSYLGYRL
jgi:hypothetical protein